MNLLDVHLPHNPGPLRGFHRTYTDAGLEILGLIFDPAE